MREVAQRDRARPRYSEYPRPSANIGRGNSFRYHPRYDRPRYEVELTHLRHQITYSGSLSLTAEVGEVRSR